MPSQPSISSWMTMNNPQGGEDDCLDALGTYAEVEERNVNGNRIQGNESCVGNEGLLDPLMGKATCSPPPTHFPLSSQADNCEPDRMDTDENDVGPRVDHESGLDWCRTSNGKEKSDFRNKWSLNDTSSGHKPLQVENEIAELGTFLSLMQPQDIARAHDFGPTLDEYAVRGVPVDCGKNWSREAIEEAVRRGPHKSATTPDAIELFKEDIKYQVDAGFAKIVEWDSIKCNLPPQLKISPVAVVPQTNRRDRIILDLSFPVRVGTEIIQQAVNATTQRTSHPKALDFLGSSVHRILQFLAHAPSEYPVYLSKYDISDGFWRMVVAAGCEWNFAYVLPQAEGEPIKLVVPNALQMGWKESPGYFCSASETARDVAEELAGFHGTMHDMPLHKFEKHIKMPDSPAEPPGTDRSVPWAAIEVFVDDFIAMCQDVERIPHLTRSILQGIEQVFPSPEVTGHVNGRTPVSEKKVMKGEADWTIEKEVLGWLIDGLHRTVILPDNKASAYIDELKKLLRKRKIPLARFRKIVGKLRFAALCLPAGKALMTPLNMAMRGNPKDIGSGKKSEVHESLGDWLQLIKSLSSRPTSVHELIAKSVDYYGYCDACKTGAGGVWFPLESELDPFVWRVKWPQDIVNRLAKYDGISISDAECAGVLLQQMALEMEVADLQHKKALPFCDNTPAVSWVTRLASKQSRVGGRLSKGIAMRARDRRMCLPEAFSVEGEENKMADVASRSFNSSSGYVFSDAELLTHFNANFPLPQNRSWKVVTLLPEDISKVVSTLRGERLTMAQWTSHAAGSTGTTGVHSQQSGMSHPSSTSAPSYDKPISSRPLLSGSAKATTAVATELLRNRLTEQSVPLGRPSSWLAGQTQQRSMAAVSESFNSAGSCRPTGEKIRHQSLN